MYAKAIYAYMAHHFCVSGPGGSIVLEGANVLTGANILGGANVL